jgi:hypothetical protein
MGIPWINKLVSVITSALQTPRIKVIGVCFGHQIIGRALNAPVHLNDMGWEMAVLPVELYPAGKALLGKDQLVWTPLCRSIIYVLICTCIEPPIFTPRYRRLVSAGCRESWLNASLCRAGHVPAR